MAVRSLAQSSLVEPFTTNSMLAGYSGNAFHHLETVRLSSAAASVTFSNLARYSDFQHLQVRAVVRSSATHSNRVNGSWRLNGDSGNNYSAHIMTGTGSSVVSEARTSVNRAERAMGDATIPTANAAANVFGAFVLDLLDPFETTKFTTSRCLSGQANSSDLRIGFASGSWRNTDSATSLILYTDDSGGFYNFVAGSRFSLYGIKARS